jgi:hypothetical protein
LGAKNCGARLLQQQKQGQQDILFPLHRSQLQYNPAESMEEA